MHEFVLLGAQPQARPWDHRLDVAKGLMDRGFHLADHLLPADRARGLDDRADRDRSEGDPRRVRRGDARDRRGSGRRPADVEGGAPPTVVVRRLDEVKAAKRAIVIRLRRAPATTPGKSRSSRSKRRRARAQPSRRSGLVSTSWQRGLTGTSSSLRSSGWRPSWSPDDRVALQEVLSSEPPKKRSSRSRPEALRREGLDTPDPLADRGALAG